MIRAAIYSGGPSLEDTWRGGYDLGIVINRAAWVVPQTYWQWIACGDLFTEYGKKYFADCPIPSAGYFAMSTTVQCDHPKTHNDRHLLLWDNLFPPVGPLPPTTSYSITAALHLAAYIGANSITVYGHDQANRNGIGGYDAKRLMSESTEIGRAVELLKTIGLSVTFNKGNIS